jgi:hypothetical protein
MSADDKRLTFYEKAMRRSNEIIPVPTVPASPVSAPYFSQTLSGDLEAAIANGEVEAAGIAVSRVSPGPQNPRAKPKPSPSQDVIAAFSSLASPGASIGSEEYRAERAEGGMASVWRAIARPPDQLT